jgi:hypothetical protein
MSSLVDLLFSIFDGNNGSGVHEQLGSHDVSSIIDILNQQGIDLSLYSPEEITGAIEHAIGTSTLNSTGYDMDHLDKVLGMPEIAGSKSGNNISFTGSSCSDCSGSCWLTCSGSCHSSND